MQSALHFNILQFSVFKMQASASAVLQTYNLAPGDRPVFIKHPSLGRLSEAVGNYHNKHAEYT
jgi:hypothetical protein